MADRRSPRRSADERTTLLALLDYERESLIGKLDGLDAETATAVEMPSGTTLLWLVRHMAGVETDWIVHRYLGEPPRDDAPGASAAPSVDLAVAAYRKAARRTDAVVLSAADLGEPCPSTGAEPPVNLRWVLVHLLGETARHAGHADILRERTDGQTGR